MRLLAPKLTLCLKKNCHVGILVDYAPDRIIDKPIQQRNRGENRFEKSVQNARNHLIGLEMFLAIAASTKPTTRL